jgi:hypothetical protein
MVGSSFVLLIFLAASALSGENDAATLVAGRIRRPNFVDAPRYQTRLALVHENLETSYCSTFDRYC